MAPTTSQDTCLEELNLYKAALSSAMHGFCSLDCNARITDVNEAYCKITGYSREELLGMSIFNLDYDNPETTAEHIKKIRERGSEHFETKMRRKDGKIIDVELLSASFSPNKEGHFFGFIQDITKRKEAERCKTEFVSMASHQLQSPITSVRWCLERLVEGKEGELTPRQKELLAGVLYSTREMSKLINDLLSISRLEMGKLKIEPKPTYLANLVQEIIKDYESLIAKKEGRVLVEIPKDLPPINLDQSLTREIIRNLITNSLNYSPQGKCEIKIKLERQDNNYLFSVSDYGIGIPKEIQHKVFEKFFRADNALKMKPKGTGLGLHIAKNFLEAANCKIWFDSEENNGTTFYVSIPLNGMSDSSMVNSR